MSELSETHRAYLNEHAISDEVIEQQEIHSEGTDIIFPWREGDLLTLQRRPWPGGAGVYFWASGEDLHLNVIRDPGPDAAVLLCEGTKQSLAVASWAPPEYAVMGMPGCYGWTMSRKLDLARFAGRRVLILLDADAAANLDVYEAGARLASELAMEDPPAQAAFVPSPAWGKDGIDDYLARIAPGRRGDRLVKLIAKAQDKPADRKPATRKGQRPDTQDRPLVLADGDRRTVVREIIGALRARWDARELFGYGGALTRLRDAQTEPLSRGAFLRWLPEGVACYRGGSSGLLPSWPDRETVEAVMASADEFAPLDRVARTPFLRPDGTVCAKNGYDPVTRTVLVTGNSGMDRLDVPDLPSQADAAAAAGFLLDTWLGSRDGRDGMPFRDQASRANALALILTPFIRGLVPLVPLAVISGLQPGVGKNLLADCLSLMVTGETCVPLLWIPDDDEEVRKQILSSFRAGSALFCFDEAHVIGGTALSRALTAVTYTDRILGVSQMASYPNQATWLALGNQVSVLNDMARRAYFIELYPDAPDPQDRDEQSFAHPDLRQWTRENRPELVTAALTLLRAWFAAGRPRCARDTAMGSFEAWDVITASVLSYAGITGFLAGLTERRLEADHAGGYWREHLAWSMRVWSDAPHTCLDVKNEAVASSGGWEAPPGLDHVMQEGYARKLGQAYAKIQDRWFGDYRLVKSGRGHNNTVKWTIENRGMVTPDPPHPPDPPVLGGLGVTNGVSPPYAGAREESPDSAGKPDIAAHDVCLSMELRGGTLARSPLTPQTEVRPGIPGTVGIDLETGDASELFTHSDDSPFVRLAGIIGAGDPQIVPVADLLAVLALAPEICGHNILGFDGLALAWHHGLDWEGFAARARDTELIARQVYPPRSRESGTSEDRYDLDHVAQLLGLPGKTDDLKRLKRQHGGYGKIPLDDPEYRAYLAGDLRATAAVAARLGHDAYTAREHLVASLAGRMSLNGFLVDQDLLARRLAAGAARKQEHLRLLHDAWGLPVSKTVLRGRGKDRHEEQQDLESPLACDSGRAWLAAVWERFGVPDPPRTGRTGKLATGADELAKVAARPECPGELRAILAAMAVVTTTRTVYQTAQGCLCPDGRVHPVNSFRQASGRWSVTNPGLTVFGKRGGRHVERDIFLPDPGDILLSFDLSQVDMRAMAWLSGDHAYRAMFAPGRDAHAEIAAQVGIGRQDAKAIGHGWNYGLGPARMIRSGLDEGKVRAFVRGMQERFPRLIAWREEIREQGRAGLVLDNGFGRRMACDPARAYTVAPALMGQGGARDIMCQSLLRLPDWCRPMLRVMVHDEIVVSVPKDCAEEAAREIMTAMTWDLDSDLPVLCDMSGGLTWGQTSAK